MTSLPAARLGLRDRGSVWQGSYADLVIFDPDTITDTATYARPHQYPEGIHHVLVNGRFVVCDGIQTEEMLGRILRAEESRGRKEHEYDTTRRSRFLKQ
jgi:N-acyl-D-amino-acid deacylase